MQATWKLAEKVQVQAWTGGLQNTWATRRLCFWGQASFKKDFLLAKAARLQRNHVLDPWLDQTPRDVSHG